MAKEKFLTYRMSDTEYKKLRSVAFLRERYMSHIVREAVKAYLEDAGSDATVEAPHAIGFKGIK